MSAQRIAPGKSGEIKATFNTAGKNGRQSKTITVTNNDPTKANFVYHMEGTITEPLSLAPGALSLRAKLNEVITDTVTITNNTDKPVKLGEPKYPDAETAQFLSLTVKPKVIAVGKTAKAIVTFNAKTAGRQFKTFTIETDAAKMPSLMVRVNTFVEESAPPVKPNLTTGANPGSGATPPSPGAKPTDNKPK